MAFFDPYNSMIGLGMGGMGGMGYSPAMGMGMMSMMPGMSVSPVFLVLRYRYRSSFSVGNVVEDDAVLTVSCFCLIFMLLFLFGGTNFRSHRTGSADPRPSTCDPHLTKSRA